MADFTTLNGYSVKDAQARVLINELTNEINSKLYGELTSSLLARSFANYIPQVTGGDLSNLPLGYMQGFCTTDSTILYAVKGADSFANNDNIVLCEIQKGTSNVTRKVNIQGFHANALAFNKSKNEVYIACNSSVSGSGTIPNNNILILDYTTLSIKEVKTPPAEITQSNRVRSVSYDNVTNTLMLGDEYTVFFMTDWDTVAKKVTLNMADTLERPTTTNIQTLKHSGKYIIQSRMSPNGLCIYDHDGNLIKNYYDLRVCDLIATGELEDAEIFDDGTIIFSTCQTIRYNTSIWTFDYTFFKSNIYKGGYQRQPYQTQKGNYLQAYCDCNSTALQLGTDAQPFGTPNQALLMANSMPLSCGIRVNIKSTGDYGWFGGIFGNQPIYLDGNNYATLHAIVVLGSHAIIDACNIEATPYVNVNTEDNPANIYIAQSAQVEIRNCKLNSGDTQQDNALLVANSKVYINGTSFTNYLNGVRLQTNADVMLYNITWSKGKYKYKCNVPEVKLYDGTSTIYNNCNPDGYIPDNTTGNWQAVEFTESGDTITVTNPRAVIGKVRMFTFSWQYQQTTVHYTTFLSAGYVNHIAGFGSEGYETVFNISVRDNDNGTFTVNWSLKQQSIDGGAWNDMSSGTTVKCTSIRSL